MTIDELNFEYNDFCNKSKDCADCKYNENFPCQLFFGYDKGRADATKELPTLRSRRMTKEEAIKELINRIGGIKA